MTQKGGSTGAHSESSSKMNPIDLWLLRRLYSLMKGVNTHLHQVYA
jgi:hypothetical protein